MRSFLLTGALLLAAVAGHTQPAGAVAMEDTRFDEQFAQRALPVVKGKLLHLGPDELKRTIVDYTLVTLFGQVRKTTPVKADGSFRLELEYPLPYQQIWLGVGELFYAGIYAHTDLQVELDMAKIKAAKEVNFNGPGVRYLGTDGPLNTYLNDYILFRRKEQLALSTRLQQVPRSRNPVAAEVLAAYTPVFDSMKVIQDDYIAQHPSPYAWLLENERMSEFYGQLSVCYWGHAMEDALLDKMKAHKTYLVSNSSMGFYKYLSTYLGTIPGNAITPQKNLTRLDSLFSPAMADLIKLKLPDDKDIDERQTGLALVQPTLHTRWSQQVARTEYAHITDKITSVNNALASTGHSATAAGFGKPSLQTGFGASLYKLSAMKGTDFLAKLRQSFPGKAIVFDLWATWCAPCLAEMPHGKTLQQDSKDLPVVFVYVCTASGSDEGKWKRKVAELQLPGIHFFVDKTLDAELAQYFSFSGYPGHAFIDRNGTYKPGAIKWIYDIKDKAALSDLVNKP